MGMARLLAKGWIVFCLFAAAHALRLNLQQGQSLGSSLPGIGICALLFIAMGLLFVGVSAPRRAISEKSPGSAGCGRITSSPASTSPCSSPSSF